MRWVKQTCVKLFRLSFSTDRSSRKSQVFRLDAPVGKLDRKTLSRKSQPFKSQSFYDFVREPDFGFSRKRPFSTDQSDCIRNGLITRDRYRVQTQLTYTYIDVELPPDVKVAGIYLYRVLRLKFQFMSVGMKH